MQPPPLFFLRVCTCVFCVIVAILMLYRIILVNIAFLVLPLGVLSAASSLPFLP